MDSCIICNSPKVAALFVFHPEAESVHRYGGIPGKKRTLFCHLCGNCSMLPEGMRDHLIKRAMKETVDDAIGKAVELGFNPPCRECGGPADMLHVDPAGGKAVVFGTCERCRQRKPGKRKKKGRR